MLMAVKHMAVKHGARCCSVPRTSTQLYRCTLHGARCRISGTIPFCCGTSYDSTAACLLQVVAMESTEGRLAPGASGEPLQPLQMTWTISDSGVCC
jgi:hypothetical protein